MRPQAYRTALGLTENEAERAFLAGRIAEVRGGGVRPGADRGE